MTEARMHGETQPAVLVVDPSKVTLVAARKLLEPHFGVYLAEDGQAAWELVAAVPEIAAVFTEQNLPKLDGTMLLRQIRESQDERIACLPVIIISSGERNEATRRAAFEAGATDFILKPFDPVDLLTRARAWSGTAQLTASLRADNRMLCQLVMLDADTRAGNRDYFLQETIKDRAFCMRHGSEHSLLYITIDNHERIIREQGRVAAREAIALAAEAIRSKCRREDTFARVADSSFALSLLQTGPIGARVLAERIRQAIAQKVFKPRGMVVALTMSIGVSSPPTDTDIPAEQLLDAAEKSAAQALRAGGNQTHVAAEIVNRAATSRNRMPAPAPAVLAAIPGTALTAEYVVANPQGFIAAVLPLLEKLGDTERLALIDRLLVMTET